MSLKSTTMEDYQAGPTLGTGTFSTVYRCFHQGLLRAVKVIDKEAVSNFLGRTSSRMSLDSEPSILKSLGHASLMKLYMYFQTETKIYMFSDLLDGGDLCNFILKNGSIHECHTDRIFTLVGDGLEYIHSENIVHRDIKPENILLTTDQCETMEPKISDFGLAMRLLKPNNSKTLCGTPMYMAPEIYRQREDLHVNVEDSGYGFPVDMWSLGVTLYITLSSLPPFDDQSNLQKQILRGEYDFNDAEWTQVSCEAKRMIEHLMCLNPETRITAAAMLEHPWIQKTSVKKKSRNARNELANNVSGEAASNKI